jgi:Sugar (and other) transporter
MATENAQPIESDMIKAGEVSSDDNGQRKLSYVDDATGAKITKTSSVIMVLVSGLALFSDGYSVQIIGYMNPLFKELYPDAFSPMIKTRLSNAYLIKEIFGMLFFGYMVDKTGRRMGIFFATLFLVLGIILATAAHGNSNLWYFLDDDCRPWCCKSSEQEVCIPVGYGVSNESRRIPYLRNWKCRSL